VVTGRATIGGHPVAIAVMDFSFLGGTLGSATGEKVRRTIVMAIQERMPLVIVSTSGGARMQEGILSLMQMAKTSVFLAELSEKAIPFISILLNPTTAGVAASYAALGDVIIAEPGAMIGFAGPRVIEQTINQALPKGFQRADFVLEHGMIDMIVPRGEMRERVGKLIDLLVEPRRTPERRRPTAAEPAPEELPVADTEEREKEEQEEETAVVEPAEPVEPAAANKEVAVSLAEDTQPVSAPGGEPRPSG
jgi:acetyl-CoA carboxylase carboxyl transferase subunit beta